MTEENKPINVFELMQMLIDTQNKLSKLRLDAIRDEISYKDMQAEAWLNINFKQAGATNDNMRKSMVREHMNQVCPPVYLSKQEKIKNLKDRIDLLNRLIDFMEEQGIDEYTFKGLDFDKN